ncbi:MAG: CehA/McbA family metallohydrolase [Thermomicrobiales bacterium]|nr:CehA/McbA family metallohydrolase [Thermomicrobiales bacterium]
METPFSRPGRFWRGSLHTHSICSDGHRSPREVCRFYQDAGYDFLALTDHFLEAFDWPLVDTRPLRSEQFTTLIGAELHPAHDRMELGREWHILAVGLPFDFAPSPAEETGPELAGRALAAGAFVAAAHPHWHTMTDRDVAALGPIHAVEVFNANCAYDNDTSDASYMLDLRLAWGQRLNACATDDAHFLPGKPDGGLGWVMVRSEALEPDALLAALKAGDYYSSTGPGIAEVTVEPGRRLTVHCSPAERIFLLGDRAAYRAAGGEGITTAEFDLSDWQSPYARVLVRDAAGKRAWTNPIWFDAE